MIFGGFRRILIEASIAVTLVPSLLYCAAHGFPQSVATFAIIFLCLCYGKSMAKKLKKPMSFFFIWYFTSILFILMSFELIASPLLMMSADEDFLFLSLISLAVYCLFITKYLSIPVYELQSFIKGSPSQSSMEKDVGNNCKKSSRTSPEFCPLFKMLPFFKNVRCLLCCMCAETKQQYCIWLDCHINSNNFDFYVLGLSFLSSGLLIYFYLVLTTACHHYLLYTLLGMDIFLPDDCSDVYYDLSTAVCFVSGLYATLIAVISLYTLFSDLIFFVNQRSTPLKFASFRMRLF